MNKILNKINIFIQSHQDLKIIIDHCREYKSKNDLKIYIVGGIVRDILLEKKINFDLDLVIEGDIDKFSKNLSKILNSKLQEVHGFPNFKLLLKEKFEIDIEDNLNVVRYIENISSKYNTNLQGFKKLFNENDLNYEAYNEEIKVELAWQKLIFNLFNDRVNFDEGEIDEEIKKIIEKKESIEEYKLAEIEVKILIGNNLETQKKLV